MMVFCKEKDMQAMGFDTYSLHKWLRTPAPNVKSTLHAINSSKGILSARFYIDTGN